MASRTELIVALDVATLDEAAAVVHTLGDAVTWYKIGKQLFTRFGPAAVQTVKAAGKHVFLDLKFHDIPNTVAQAVRSAASLGADITNVHASGGRAMLKAAADAARETGLIVLGVTVLTSMDAAELRAVGITASPEEQVVRLARLAQAAGVPGVVCSALEIAALRQACGPDFLLVVPGIRPAGAAHDDQARVMTPAEAARAGASYIVVGRPILKAPSPAEAARAIRRELNG
ncbi:MAG: Orotidine 5'-phosphate decarboxylase [Lentisphaerae bacterium ADurb.BinA184]|nr:MAG: Orotidine 5'-phosphate decarboxylase [Lentisphaerae bacterium ADurb.BinA184]